MDGAASLKAEGVPTEPPEASKKTVFKVKPRPVKKPIPKISREQSTVRDRRREEREGRSRTRVELFRLARSPDERFEPFIFVRAEKLRMEPVAKRPFKILRNAAFDLPGGRSDFSFGHFAEPDDYINVRRGIVFV